MLEISDIIIRSSAIFNQRSVCNFEEKIAFLVAKKMKSGLNL